MFRLATKNGPLQVRKFTGLIPTLSRVFSDTVAKSREKRTEDPKQAAKCVTSGFLKPEVGV